MQCKASLLIELGRFDEALTFLEEHSSHALPLHKVCGCTLLVGLRWLQYQHYVRCRPTACTETAASKRCVVHRACHAAV